MEKYHKINTVFHRDPDNNFKTLLHGQWSEPEFELLADITWEWTEKVDGTNIRVIWESDRLNAEFKGKTDNAQIPSDLVSTLRNTFLLEDFEAAFPDLIGKGAVVTLYGEGYGNKIQKVGSRYIPDMNDFVLFDVNINGIWLDRDDVDDIAEKMGINSVPVIGEGTLHEAIVFTQLRPITFSMMSYDKTLPIEGIVCRPKTELLTKTGKRIITKLKYKDFGR